MENMMTMTNAERNFNLWVKENVNVPFGGIYFKNGPFQYTTKDGRLFRVSNGENGDICLEVMIKPLASYKEDWKNNLYEIIPLMIRNINKIFCVLPDDIGKFADWMANDGTKAEDSGINLEQFIYFLMYEDYEECIEEIIFSN